MKRIFLWCLVIIFAGAIFYLSSQPADVSNKVSKKVTEMVDKSKKPISNKVVRKIAHFCMFGLFGASLLLLNLEYGVKLPFILSVGICLVYAITDEIHQIFVPGRGAQVLDVVLDFSGGLIITSIIMMMKASKEKRNMLKEQSDIL